MAKRKKKAARSKARGRGKAKAKRGGRKSATRENIVVTSKMKAYLRSNGYKAAGDLVDAVNSKVHEVLDGAMRRTTENKRSTVRPHDV